MKRIWLEENEYGKLEPLSDEVVKKAEELLNVTLPSSYVNILKQQNGGVLRYNAYPTDVPTSWADDHVNVDLLFGIGVDKEKGILESEYLIQEWGLPKNIVLISGEGHSWIALDYRNCKVDPPVIFIDVEQNQEVRLAGNFEEFLTGLFVYVEKEDHHLLDSVPSFNEYYSQIDNVIESGTPKEIDRLFTKVLSTTNELIRYMVEKMRQHEKPKVHFNLLLFLSCCAEGDNRGVLEDDYLFDVLTDFTNSKNKDVKEFAIFSLEQLKGRLNK